MCVCVCVCVFVFVFVCVHRNGGETAVKAIFVYTSRADIAGDENIEKQQQRQQKPFKTTAKTVFRINERDGPRW